jgi:hypothetical protein
VGTHLRTYIVTVAPTVVVTDKCLNEVIPMTDHLVKADKLKYVPLADGSVMAHFVDKHDGVVFVVPAHKLLYVESVDDYGNGELRSIRVLETTVEEKSDDI